MAGRLGSVALLLVSLTLSAEAGSFVYLHYVVKVSWMPDYASQSMWQGDAWFTEREAWGAWHQPNATSRQQGQCFSVALHANSVGARDRERTIDGNASRTIVLGDSFAEGWGVEADERVSNLLEARLHREFLNFAAENDLGPLQYQILYERLASKFAHDQVLIMLLPDNDFTDNDAEYWRRTRPDFYERHRPYYQAAEPDGYRAFYPVAIPPDGFRDWYSVPPIGLRAQAANFIWRNSWSVTLYRYLSLQGYHRGDYSGYLDYTEDQLKAVLWSLAKIKELAGDRRVTVAVIPRLRDFQRVSASGDHRLSEALDRFGQAHGIEVVDLMQLMPAVEPRTETYYLPCEGHWSAAGNRIAADALAAALRAPQASR
jgi:lysophospholipase L1-like esterase